MSERARKVFERAEQRLKEIDAYYERRFYSLGAFDDIARPTLLMRLRVWWENARR